MPGYNRTGPMGQGSMTGRGQGPCSTGADTYPSSYTQGPRFGRGLGMRRGNRFNQPGLGRRFGLQSAWNQPQESRTYSGDTAQEITLLKTQANSIKQALDTIYSQIKTLEKTMEET